ncbi:MAG: hypothetical protein RR547_02740, partial [Raoultibacter sp.]
KTIHFKHAIKQDQDALLERAREIARQLTEWIADKPHDVVVIEGFIGFTGRQGGYAFQTPYLCGFLHSILASENVVIQTSRKVFNPQTPRNMARVKDDLARGYMAIPYAEKITNDHLRSAAVHGWYYLTSKGLIR